MKQRDRALRPTALARFQDAFARALLDDGAPVADATIAALRSQPGFAVYRNTVVKGCVDALQANYPAVARLVGDPWFRAAAAIYVRRAPPSQPCLVDYGEGFSGFLADFAPAAQLPYLPDVARLDRLWTEAHLAPDDAPLDAASVAALAPAELADTVLRPNAAARWAWFADHPAFSIWRHSRSADTASTGQCAVFEPDWHAEGALIVRSAGKVSWSALNRGACALLDACAAGRRLDECAAVALAADPSTDLAASMAGLLRDGAFGRLQRSSQPMEATT